MASSGLRGDFNWAYIMPRDTSFLFSNWPSGQQKISMADIISQIFFTTLLRPSLEYISRIYVYIYIGIYISYVSSYGSRNKDHHWNMKILIMIRNCVHLARLQQGPFWRACAYYAVIGGELVRTSL